MDVLAAADSPRLSVVTSAMCDTKKKPKETRDPLSQLTLKGFRVLCGVFLRGCYAAATLIYWRLYMCSRLRCSLARNLSAAAIKALNSG